MYVLFHQDFQTPTGNQKGTLRNILRIYIILEELNLKFFTTKSIKKLQKK